MHKVPSKTYVIALLRELAERANYSNGEYELQVQRALEVCELYKSRLGKLYPNGVTQSWNDHEGQN